MEFSPVFALLLHRRILTHSHRHNFVFFNVSANRETLNKKFTEQPEKKSEFK